MIVWASTLLPTRALIYMLSCMGQFRIYNSISIGYMSNMCDYSRKLHYTNLLIAIFKES